MINLLSTNMNAVREIRSLIEEIADVDWSHPGWWILVGGTALLESTAQAVPRPRPGRRGVRRAAPVDESGNGGPPLDEHYVNSNGTPRTDTFIGRGRADGPRPHAAPHASAALVRPAERVAEAVMRARAALDTIAAFDGRFVAQPLSCYLSRAQPLCRRVPLAADARRVAMITPRGVVSVRIGADERDDAGLVASLARFCAAGISDRRLRPLDVGASVPTPVAVAVSLLQELPATARHLHRRAWSRGGGPWLGVGDAGDSEIVTTCHMVVDGLGHTAITRDIFARVDRRSALDRRALVAAAAAVTASERGSGVHEMWGPQPPIADALPLGIASVVLPDLAPSFTRFAYALGKALERFFGHVVLRRTNRFSPAFQVPVLPGDPADPERWLRRTVPGVLSVRRTADGWEPFEQFRRRVPGVLAREAAAQGLLGRMRQAVIDTPAPTTWKRRLLASRPHRFRPVLEVLSGRGCMSSMRFPGAEQPPEPLVAVSSPGLYPTPAGPGGSTILTTMDTAAGLAVTVSGTGFAGTERGAQAFLDLWLGELEQAGAYGTRTPYRDVASSSRLHEL